MAERKLGFRNIDLLCYLYKKLRVTMAEGWEREIKVKEYSKGNEESARYPRCVSVLVKRISNIKTYVHCGESLGRVLHLHSKRQIHILVYIIKKTGNFTRMNVHTFCKCVIFLSENFALIYRYA